MWLHSPKCLELALQMLFMGIVASLLVYCINACVIQLLLISNLQYPLASYEIKYLCHLSDIQGCLGCFGFFSTDLFEILLNGNEQLNNCNNFLITFLHFKEFWKDRQACVVDTHLWAENIFFCILHVDYNKDTLVFSLGCNLMLGRWGLDVCMNHIPMFTIKKETVVGWGWGVYLAQGDRKMDTAG